MKKNLLHYGLQRSGTNYLENLLKKNFNINICNNNDDRAHPLQKHFRLYADKELIPEPQYRNSDIFETFEDYITSLGIKQKIDGVIIISKDPYSWLLSYKNWGAKCNWPSVNHHYAEEYNLFYKKWLEFSRQDPRIQFVRYIDLLTGPHKELLIIKEKFHLEYRFLVKLIGVQSSLNKVAQSNSFTKNKSAYYLEKKFLNEYDFESLNKLNKIIDDDLLNALNYEKVQW